MNFREARAGEAGVLSDIAFRSKAYWGYSEDFMRACRAELTYSARDLECMYFALVEDPDIVGFYALDRVSADEVELEALFVVPEAIGRGYGRVLVAHARLSARAMGASSIVIQGDPNAEPFYLAMGAVATGERESHSIPGRFLPTFAILLERREDDGA